MISNQNSKRLYARRNVVVFKYLFNDCFECTFYHTCLKVPVVSYNQDIAVGAKQLADYLLVSKIKTYSEDIGYYDEKGEENTIIFDKRRLVKTPGYEILITDIDDVIFFEKDAYMYMTITRGQQKYTYMICDLYRKQEDYVEE